MDSLAKLYSIILPLVIAVFLVLNPISASHASDTNKISKIADLLADRDGNGQIDRLGEEVTVRGKATVATNVLNNQYLMLYMQDSTAGIMVFSETLNIPIKKGDSLRVTGTLKLHASKPEIVVDDLEILNSGDRVPEAKPLSQVFKNPDGYRGLLVSGEAEVQNSTTAKDTKMFRISSSAGADDSLHVFVSRSNIHYEDFNFDALSAGDRIHISGILIRYFSNFDNSVYYQVLPRSPDDLRAGNLQPSLKENSFIYADLDTTSSTVYLLLEDGLWGYDLSDNNWRFLDALEDFEGSFSDYEFGFNSYTKAIQLWSRGMGKLFSVDPQTYSIKRKDHSSNHKNQLGHFPFYRDSTLYAFGGYGFWDYHNMMLHFNHSRNKWAVQTVDNSSSYPSRRVPATGMYDQQQDRLYIFGGRGTQSGNIDDQNATTIYYRDIWSFSFDHQKWARIMTLDHPANSSDITLRPSPIGAINKHSSSLFLPDEQLWLIPSFNTNEPGNSFHFSAVHLPSRRAKGTISPNFAPSGDFMPTNYFYNPNENEAVFVGINNRANADSYPVRIERLPVDSLTSKISPQPFYLSTNLHYYLIGLAVIGGVLFLFYRNQNNDEKPVEQTGETIPFQSLLQAKWYDKQEKELLKYMNKKDRFLDSQEIEELLWNDIESYDYRRRLRNDILKEINRKFQNHYSLGKIILRKKDPTDNRRYLYGLNRELLGE